MPRSAVVRDRKKRCCGARFPHSLSPFSAPTTARASARQYYATQLGMLALAGAAIKAAVNLVSFLFEKHTHTHTPFFSLLAIIAHLSLSSHFLVPHPRRLPPARLPVLPGGRDHPVEPVHHPSGGARRRGPGRRGVRPVGGGRREAPVLPPRLCLLQGP